MKVEITIGEAMLCQAVVCSDNKGFREMAKDEESELLPVGDAEKIDYPFNKG